MSKAAFIYCTVSNIDVDEMLAASLNGWCLADTVQATVGNGSVPNLESVQISAEMAFNESKIVIATSNLERQK